MKVAFDNRIQNTKNVLRNSAKYNRNSFNLSAPSFSGSIVDFFKKAEQPPLNYKVLDSVKPEFVNMVNKYVSAYSSKWLEKIRASGYHVIFSPSWQKAYQDQGFIYFNKVINAEKANPKGTLAITHFNHTKPGGFIVFCDKPLFKKEIAKYVVNHELSHAVVDIEKLDKNPDILSSLLQDVQEISSKRKLDRLKGEEREMVSKILLPDDKNSKNEIITDVFAWTHGGGAYGGGVVGGIKNPKLMKNLFPELAEKLSKL